MYTLQNRQLLGMTSAIQYTIMNNTNKIASAASQTPVATVMTQDAVCWGARLIQGLMMGLSGSHHPSKQHLQVA